jgi:flagellar biosynthesis/type III secretory pathway chaperone
MIDVIVKENQRIDEVIIILQENYIIQSISEIHLRSWRLQTLINRFDTFRQANIENGDILEFM